MAIKNLLTASGVYGVATYADLVVKHTGMVARLRARGIEAEIATDKTPQIVRVDHGRWLFDCTCGSGVAAHPDWPDARCFGCGTVYSSVQFPDPDDQAAISDALVARPVIGARNWRVGEAVADLVAENVERGVVDVKGRR